MEVFLTPCKPCVVQVLAQLIEEHSDNPCKHAAKIIISTLEGEGYYLKKKSKQGIGKDGNARSR